MAHDTTRWLDTGSGPGATVPVRPAGEVTKMMATYRTYLAHIQQCPGSCKSSGPLCETGDRLYADYREARIDNSTR